MKTMKDIIVEFPKGDYKNIDALENVIHYIMRLDNMGLVGGCGINLTSAGNIARQFYEVKKFYNKKHGKQVIHIVFTISRSNSLNAVEVKKLGWMLSGYFSRNRQVLFAVHDDTANLHVHMAVNTVAFTNGEYCDYFDQMKIKEYAEMCLCQIMSDVYMGERVDLMKYVVV